MKIRFISGIALAVLAVSFSCQKAGNQNSGSSLAANLYTASAEVAATQVTKNLTSDEQSIACEKFDGSTPAFIEGNGGMHLDFGLHGWGMHGGPLKFGIPHIDSCVTVTVSDSAYPRQIVIEYLPGCSMHHRDKQGTVVINISDTITKEGALQTITYSDFYIDSMKIDLTGSVENLGKNANGNWVIEKKYTQTITRDDETVVRTNHELIEWISGFETTDRSDNIFYISGSGTVVVNDTASFSKTITTPLLFDAACDYIKSGVVELNRRGSVSVIDYGDGTCDDIATVTTDGITEEINLHSHMFREGGKFRKHCNGFGHGFHH